MSPDADPQVRRGGIHDECCRRVESMDLRNPVRALCSLSCAGRRRRTGADFAGVDFFLRPCASAGFRESNQFDGSAGQGFGLHRLEKWLFRSHARQRDAVAAGLLPPHGEVAGIG